jgi:hypothetical protein
MPDIHAPWTSEQVDALNAFQKGGGFHPYTCGGDHAGPSPDLVATTDGWRCPQDGCEYRQDWAMAFAFDPANHASALSWPSRTLK